jgi:hypothetical protein
MTSISPLISYAKFIFAFESREGLKLSKNGVYSSVASNNKLITAN